ncbi:MAG: amidohydrolase family protein, partial [Lachnospiraceae bacterium]|nr:amidohydrolase family protein [Lachnospiraceae bacterium]
MERFALRGDFVFADEKRKLEVREDSYLVVDEEGRIASLSKTLPEADRHIEVLNRRGKLILPGMTDLHLHAPQYTYRGMGMDLELLDWLNTYTFPEESRYKDLSYADTAYDIFVEDLFRSYTTRAVIFATIFPESTLLLMDKLEASGLITYVGKLNMDRNAPSFYVEDTGDSLKATRQWIRESRRRYLRTFPILTPRFIPSCSDALMRGLGEIAKEEKVPLQSHLSENRKEIQLVQKLVPEASFYGDAYDRIGT